MQPIERMRIMRIIFIMMVMVSIYSFAYTGVQEQNNRNSSDNSKSVLSDRSNIKWIGSNAAGPF